MYVYFCGWNLQPSIIVGLDHECRLMTRAVNGWFDDWFEYWFGRGLSFKLSS
jgi:hypothetical protein